VSTAALRWLANIYAGGTPSKDRVEFWEDGTVPWLNSGSVNDWAISSPSTYITDEALRNSSARWIPPRSVVIALAGQGRTKGTSARLEFASTCNQSMAAIVPSVKLDYRYLHFALASQYESIRNMAGGDLRDGLNLQHIGDIRIPSLALEEQRRIADFLDDQVARIDQVIAARDDQRVLLEKLRRSILPSLIFEPGLRTSKLGRLASISHGRQRSPESESGPFMTPYIRSANVQDGRLLLEDVKEMNFTPSERSRYELRAGDVLVTEASGSAESIGATARWNDELAGCVCFQNHVVRLRPRDYSTEPAYLYWWARASYAGGAMRVWATGANILNLGSESLSAMPVPLRMIAEQHEVIDRCEADDERHVSLQRELVIGSQRLSELKRALVSAAVSGEFDVSAASGRGVLV